MFMNDMKSNYVEEIQDAIKSKQKEISQLITQQEKLQKNRVKPKLKKTIIHKNFDDLEPPKINLGI